ncbi:hypothetical protein O3P69_020400 [Scylla paramamosain]|uniref:Uncharacterized protein n=1 Tax=Scylla paramamosain TaxID=85552 RepID=A0AAW0TM85_SCYPA
MSKWKGSYESGRTYHAEWEKEFPWVTKAKDGTQQAYCKLCHKVTEFERLNALFQSTNGKPSTLFHELDIHFTCRVYDEKDMPLPLEKIDFGAKFLSECQLLLGRKKENGMRVLHQKGLWKSTRGDGVNFRGSSPALCNKTEAVQKASPTKSFVSSVSSRPVTYPSDISFLEESEEEEDALPPNRFYNMILSEQKAQSAKTGLKTCPLKCCGTSWL